MYYLQIAKWLQYNLWCVTHMIGAQRTNEIGYDFFEGNAFFLEIQIAAKINIAPFKNDVTALIFVYCIFNSEKSLS